MKHLDCSESTQRKSQNDRPSPEIPQESRAKLRIPARVFDVEGDAACSKNSTFGYFDGAAWTPRLGSPTPIMAPGSSLFAMLLTRNKTSIFLHVQFFSLNVIVTAQVTFSMQTFYVSEKVIHSRLQYYDKLITLVLSTDFVC